MIIKSVVRTLINLSFYATTLYDRISFFLDVYYELFYIFFFVYMALGDL